MSVGLDERIRASLSKRQHNLRDWMETKSSGQKKVVLGPADEDAVHSHIHTIERSLEQSEDGTLGTCVVCAERVELGRLEVDYTCCICLDHLSAEEARELERELELAQVVQKSLLPQSLPKIPGLEIAAYSRPAQILGGDYFDFAEFKDGTHCLAIADVAGHGVSASLHMASIQAMLQAVVPTSQNPSEVVSQIHKLFVHNIHFTTFVTLFIGAFDPSTQLLTYCNAGHNPPIVVHSLDEALGSTEYMHPTGPALGLIEEAVYEEQSIELFPGDLLLMYTDGLVEAMNPQHEMYGVKRLQSVVEGCLSATPEDVIHEVKHSVEDFVEGAPLSDDTTILTCRFS